MAGYKPTEGEGQVTDDGEEDESFEEDNGEAGDGREEEKNGPGDESEAEQSQEDGGNHGSGSEEDDEHEGDDEEEDDAGEEEGEEESPEISDDSEEVEIIDDNDQPPSRAATHPTEVNGGGSKEAPQREFRRLVLQKDDPNPEPLSDEDVEDPDYTRWGQLIYWEHTPNLKIL